MAGLVNTAAQAPAAGALYVTGNGKALGAVDCVANQVAIPAFVVVLPLQDKDGDGSLFDGVEAGLPNGAVACIQSPGTPSVPGNDDVVISESSATLMGWLSAHTL
jgi:hypothetical protein